MKFSHKQIIIAVLGVVVSISILAVGGYLYWQENQKTEQVLSDAAQKQAEIMVKKQQKDSLIEVNNCDQKSTIQAIDSTWNLYTNSCFGFEIKVPKLVGGSVIDNITFPVKIEEDHSKKVVSLRPDDPAWPIYVSAWSIQIVTILNENELRDYARERYQNGCDIKEQKQTTQDGVYDVILLVKFVEGGPEDENCIINYQTVFKYYPGKHIAVTWDVGQDYSFWKSQNEAYDLEMIESFKFFGANRTN